MPDANLELRHHPDAEAAEDPASLILAALAAGAAAAAKDQANNALNDTYNQLTALLAKRFQKHAADQPTATPALPTDPAAILKAHKTTPDNPTAPLEHALKATGADQNQHILTTARALPKASQPTRRPSRSASYPL